MVVIKGIKREEYVKRVPYFLLLGFLTCPLQYVQLHYFTILFHSSDREDM